LPLSGNKLPEFRPMRNHDARNVNKDRGFAVRSSSGLGKKCPCWYAAFGVSAGVLRIINPRSVGLPRRWSACGCCRQGIGE
jgi:hypothetical protein